MSAMIRAVLTVSLATLMAGGQAWSQSEPPSPAAPPAATAPQPVQPRRFATVEAGFAALADAARRQDVRALTRVLGEEGRSLLRTGDRASDAEALARFATAYDAKAEILLPTPDRAIIQVGTDGWPLPIPMIRQGGTWRFDARQGAEEIITRRIGSNELDTIETLRAIVDAQDDYARGAGRQGAFQSYARRFFSTPGQHDGLFWATVEGEAPSPLGPLVAAASAGAYGRRQPGDTPQPLHGYLFKMLEAQGPAADGGAMDFVVNGRMIGGFGVIAWPVQYGRSGIKTFIVSHAGVVYERDLGPNTAQLVRHITAFDPAEGWRRVAD